jgi:FkbM family methyltransferase
MFEVVKSKKGKNKKIKFKLNDFEKKIILDEVCYAKHYFPKINTSQDFSIKEEDIIIDIGANVGIFSVYAANLAKKGKVYAFEPVKENFDRLKFHRELNRVGNLFLINKGVSNKNKKIKIYLCSEHSGGHSTNKNKLKALNESIKSVVFVECVSLKTIFDQYEIKRCDFLKIDCEGEEYKILKCLPKPYFKRIEKIALEFHPSVNEIKLAKHLVKMGFRVTISNFGSKLGMIFAKKK